MTSSSRIARRRASAKADGGAAYQEKRREVISTATEVFREKGFSATTLNDIAAAVGTDRASLYYYIGSKRELFEEIVRDAVVENVEQVEKIRDATGDAAEKVTSLISVLMESYTRNYPILYVYIQEDMTQLSGKSTWVTDMRSLDKRYTQAVVEIIQQGIDSGEFESVASAQIIAFGLIGMMNWTHRWYRPDKYDHAEISSAYAGIFLGGLEEASGS